MENDEAPKKSFEQRYTACMLWVVAGLLLASIGYTARLWGVKVGLATLLIGLGVFFLFRSMNRMVNDA